MTCPLHVKGVGNVDLLSAKCIHKLQQVCQPISQAYSEVQQRKLWEMDHLLLKATVPCRSIKATSLYTAAFTIAVHHAINVGWYDRVPCFAKEACMLGLLSSLRCQAQLRQVVLISTDNTFEAHLPAMAELHSVAQMVCVLAPAGKVSCA